MAAVGDEDISSLPLPSGAEDSRNDISDVGLMLLANEERLRPDLQVDGCVSESHAPHQPALSHDALPRTSRSLGGNDGLVSDPLAHRSSLPQSRTPETVYYHEEDGRSNVAGPPQDDADESVSEALQSLGRSLAEVDGDEDDWLVPSTGVLGGGGGGGGSMRDTGRVSLADAPSATAPLRTSVIENAFAQPRAPSAASRTYAEPAAGALGRIDFSQTERAMNSAANVGSYGELRSPSRARFAEESRDADLSGPSASALSSDDHSGGSVSASHTRSRSMRTSSVSETGSERSRKSHSRNRRHRHNDDRRRSHRRRSPKRREQTYAEFQESIRDRVKQQEDMEKREMLLLFYQKQQYEKAEVPQKFFREGLNSDLMEMRWWYYKLIRDTRINDEVADLKSKIVNGSRFALFLNNQIGNPLNLRLDKNFPKELANVLNTSTDRHLREHIKSKCGVSGPKPRPWSHILRDVWECGLNYHQNSVAVEESEKKRANSAQNTAQRPANNQSAQSAPWAVPTPAPPTFNAFRALQTSQGHPPTSSAAQHHGGVANHPQEQYQRLLEQQAIQRRMFQGQLQQMQQQSQYQQQQQPQRQTTSEQQQQFAAPPIQPNRAPLRNVFQNMSGRMREQPIPQHLRPPTVNRSGAQQAHNVSLADAARAMRQKLGVPARLGPPKHAPVAPSAPRAPAPRSTGTVAGARPPPRLQKLASPPSMVQPLPQKPLQKLPSATRPAAAAPVLSNAHTETLKTAQTATTVAAKKKSLNEPVAAQTAAGAAAPAPAPARPAAPASQVPRNNSLWSRLQNPPAHLPQIAPPTPKPASSEAPMPQTAVGASQKTGNTKRSLVDLMQELQSAHDEDDQSYETDETIFSERAGEMPDLPQDRFADTVALMEDFTNDNGEDTEAEENARKMASLHDIDDLLGISLSEVAASSQNDSREGGPSKSSRRSRKRRNRANRSDRVEASGVQLRNEPAAPESDRARARTPSPQPDARRVKRESGRASVGRTGRLEIDY